MRNLVVDILADIYRSLGMGLQHALALCAIIAVAIRSLRPAQIAALLALVCAGAFARIATPVPRLVVPPPEFFRVDPDSFREEKVEIVAHVTNDGALLAIDESRERFEMETESIELDGEKFLQPVGIRATIYGVSRAQL